MDVERKSISSPIWGIGRLPTPDTRGSHWPVWNKNAREIILANPWRKVQDLPFHIFYQDRFCVVKTVQSRNGWPMFLLSKNVFWTNVHLIKQKDSQMTSRGSWQGLWSLVKVGMEKEDLKTKQNTYYLLHHCLLICTSLGENSTKQLFLLAILHQQNHQDEETLTKSILPPPRDDLWMSLAFSFWNAWGKLKCCVEAKHNFIHT